MGAMFGDWQPTQATEQAPVPTNVQVTGQTLTWDDSQYTLLWAVYKDGNIIDFISKAEYTATEAGSYTIRAANEMGGLSEASEAVEVTVSGTTGINEIQDSGLRVQSSEVFYNLSGQRVAQPAKGLYIVNGKKVIMK